MLDVSYEQENIWYVTHGPCPLQTHRQFWKTKHVIGKAESFHISVFLNIGLKNRLEIWNINDQSFWQKLNKWQLWLTQNCTSIAAGKWRVFQAFFPFLLVLPRVTRWLGLRMWVCCRQHHASDVLWSTYFLIKGEVPNPFSSTFADALPSKCLLSIQTQQSGSSSSGLASLWPHK